MMIINIKEDNPVLLLIAPPLPHNICEAINKDIDHL